MVNMFKEITFYQGNNKGFYKLERNFIADILIRLLRDIEIFNTFSDYNITIYGRLYFFDNYFKAEDYNRHYKDPKIVYNLLLNNFCDTLFYHDFNKIKFTNEFQKYKETILNDIIVKIENRKFKTILYTIRKNEPDRINRILTCAGYSSITQFKTAYLKFLHDNGINENYNKIDFKMAA
jgi:hypothetical protein